MKTKFKVLMLLGAAVFLIGCFAFKPVEAKKIVVIDAGHGGHDLGAKIYDFDEKTIVEAISKKIKESNKNENIEIVLLREGDHFMELSERVSIINNLKPNLVISLHVSSTLNDGKKDQMDAYVSSKNEKFKQESIESAEKLLSNISNESLTKGKVKEAPFYIMKNSECPSVLLELGYLTNEKNRDYITSAKGQKEIASKILEAVK
ncbi:N-acetylmuramoyl-L-alanine amidase [Flavobacterium piscis]|uniref:N-acetylmuramoyl-L-alanine amidase n=1 Tax=Flavobacterium piscis TaxID=1114874 RepID=A0ABX2XCK3_9FLAO|nr:N-acetylmuramoyl-L-alanine amidase [Flavobacterium piscis]OCB69471.1 hypothetical protein FLP_22565 [Flavobacterium piscis]OXG01650.1 N-acetylmuramoyl-L-alanine amidase [Flavobacterium piscis]